MRHSYNKNRKNLLIICPILNLQGCKEQSTFGLIIDFGWANKISDNLLQIIKQQFASNDFKSALTTLLSAPRLDGKIPANFEEFKWIVEGTDDSINSALSELNDGRKEQIEKLIEYSKSVQSNPENFYPILPITWQNYIDYMPRRFYLSNELK
jgi:hypothetical protein